MKIVVATHNEHKLGELKEIIKHQDIELVSLKNYDIDMSVVEENGDTFIDNAIIKAKYVASIIDEFVLADDSGLCLEAYPELLGVHTARFRQDLDYPGRQKVVYEMIKDKTNKAAFKCALCLITPTKEVITVEAITEGEIHEPKGLKGFGYDPVFYSYDLNIRFSEVDENVKNSVSHRGRAGRMIIDELKKRGLINE